MTTSGPDMAAPTAPPSQLAISHPHFPQGNQVVFARAAGDGAPIVRLHMGGAGVAITLPALRKHLGIAEDSPDGRMLALIAESLDFVPQLRAGDALPEEVLSGGASWQAGEAHLLRATTRLRLRLVAWYRRDANALPGSEDALLQHLANDPDLHRLIAAAFRHARDDLGLENSATVVALADSMAGELAFIEALREHLLDRLAAISTTISAATKGVRGGASQTETLIQVRRLLATALAQIGERFTQVDNECARVVAMLREAASYRSLIRSNRDFLYRNKRDLEPMMVQWDGAPAVIDAGFWPRIATCYRSLAPRYMATQTWPRGNRLQGDGTQKPMFQNPKLQNPKLQNPKLQNPAPGRAR